MGRQRVVHGPFAPALTTLLAAVAVLSCGDAATPSPTAPADAAATPDIADVASDADGPRADVLRATPEDVPPPEDSAPPDALPPQPDAGDPGHVFGQGIERPRIAKEAASGPLRAGVAVAWSDGPVGVSMAGYGGRSGLKTPWSDVLKGSRGFLGRSNLKVLVLEVDGERLAFIKSPFMSS